MLTRSSLSGQGVGASSSSSSSASSGLSRKSLQPEPVVRSRKRKSTVLQDDDRRSRSSNGSSSYSHRSRHSVSSTHELRELQYNNIFPPAKKPSVNVNDRKMARRKLRSSTASSDVSVKSYRRKLEEQDYESRSSASSVSYSSSGSSSYASTRRSSRRLHSDEDSSVVSSVRSDGSSIIAVQGGFGIDDVTPKSKYGLRSVKSDVQDSTRSRPCTLPSVCFANCEEIWDLMCKMDLKYQRNPDLFKNHPMLGPQMRAILLDWIMDVCEAYKMHRETLYLAIDYLDRYLAVQRNVPKAHLQLIGITCLFVAAKLEEIYPPKLKTFAYVTDGACSESEILDMELVLMKTLKWKLTPITPATWVNIYLQILSYKNGELVCTRSAADFIRASIRDKSGSDARLVKHLYDRVDYVRVIRLVDLAILDAQSLNFTYSTLSAAAIYHVKGRAAAMSSSGFTWEQIANCVNWMAPAAMVLRRHEIPPVLPTIEEVSDENRHLIQSHGVTLDMLSDAESLATSKICSPLNHTEGLLTPPSSGEKSGQQRRSLKSNSQRY